MWSQIVLCLLVGLAYASNSNPAWKENTEYVYDVRGRTLSSLHEVSNQYSGILMKAKLVMQPRSNGKIQAKIAQPQYSQIHSELEQGWNTHIPDSEIQWKNLEMSGRTFQLEMPNGVIENLIVDSKVSNWEANIIKSIISQFQLNTKAVNALRSRITSFSEGEDKEDRQNSAVFKTMEDTVTGNTETLYDIHELPAYTLQNEPWMARHLQLEPESEVIEVVKHKNYSHNVELPSYFYGFENIEYGKPATNQMGNFLVRESMGRAILTGNMNKYTVQNSYTVNNIVVNPTLNDKQKASVMSMLNVTLREVKSQTDKLEEVSNPLELGNLVYSYNHPFAQSNDVREKKPYEGRHQDELESAENESFRSHWKNSLRRLRRSIHGSQNDDSSSSQSEENYQQSQPKINEAPKTPLLPFAIGYKGRSIKEHQSVQIQQSVMKLAKEINEELKDTQTFLRENSLNKFTIMTSLIRLMNEKELKEVASELYNKSQQGHPKAWKVFRDSVAQAGTGPAFLTIQDWIQSEKIQGDEAAQMIQTMANAARQPTFQYMKAFFECIKKPEVQRQQTLFEAALLGYTDLCRKVYVNKREQKNQYPIKSFGTFNTEEGREFLRSSVIPYLTQQLSDNVEHANAQKIHLYIRALGNVGHPEILSAFEPYLEGKKQVSQFQRFMMIVALDKLTQTHPKNAQSVLYKVYQNSGESEEVRVAAVGLLMRTSPPSDILQRMASYTNIDKQENVNAAVKSAIQNGAQLQGREHRYLRASCEAAESLLTKKDYGVQHGGFAMVREYTNKQLRVYYKSILETIGNREGFLPKGLKYSLYQNFNGMFSQSANVQAMVSSVDELIHVGEQQFGYHQREEQQQQSSGQEQGQYQWSSQNIARLLQMKNEEREQLEGYIYMELAGLQKFLSFDNHTMKDFPNVIRKLEEQMKNGKKIQYTKFGNGKEMAISFPTEMGFPFLYTYDTPSMVQLEGTIEGSASPQISRDNKVNKPETATLRSNLELIVSTKVQGRLSFITPFDHQQYSAGYDKNFQVHVPLNGKVEVDVKNGQLNVEIEPKQSQQNTNLLHFSTWPYTSQTDILKFQPVSSQENTYYINQMNVRTFDKIFGKKQTGMAVRVEIHHERQSMDLLRLSNIFQKADLLNGLRELWEDHLIQSSLISITHIPQQSSAKKCLFRVGYNHKYQSQSGDDKTDNSAFWNQLSQQHDSLQRQKNLIEKVGAGIKSAGIQAYDASVEFQGENNVKYTVSGAFAKSNVDPKSRVLIHFQKKTDRQDDKSYEASFQAKSYIPNTNGLDLTESLKTEPKMDTQVQFTFGTGSEQSPSKVEGTVEFRRSGEREEYLQQLPMYQECKREMSQGNFQLPACANMTMDANLLDRVNIKVNYENLKPELVQAIQTIQRVLRANYCPSLEVNQNEQEQSPNQINVKARFDPDLKYLNISLRTQNEEAFIRDIRVGEWAKETFVAHPVFHLRSRIAGKALSLDTYRPICVVDQSASNTFDNKTYPTTVSKHWTVMMQYVPKTARQERNSQRQENSVEDQLKYQTENYVVLVRQNPQSSDRKEVKIVLSSPQSNFKNIDVTMSPQNDQGKGSKARVTVDDKEVKISDRQSNDVYDDYVQIYALPNGEVKAEVKNAFYVIYDGKRVKLTATNSKFRDSSRGLCGNFNGQKVADFLAPEDCIMRNSKEFVKSYDIEDDQERQQPKGRRQECLPRNGPLYANVISDRDSNRQNEGQHADKCMKFQTRYVEENDQVCFTLRALPTCLSSCQASGQARKNVPVHCVQRSHVAKLWKAQIDKGASPDFSSKKETKTVQIEIPQKCVN